MPNEIVPRRINSFGESRRPAYYQGTPTNAAYQKMMGELYSGKRWIENPSFALEKDADIWKKIRLDPVIAKALDMRMHLTAGTNFFWEAPDMQSRALIPYFDGLLQSVSGFRQSLLAMTQAIIRGISFLKMDTNGSLGKFLISPD